MISLVIVRVLQIQSGPKKCIHSSLINIFGINLNEISTYGGSLKDDVYRRKPATLDDLRESIAMSFADITLDTLQNVVHASAGRLRQCLDADGGHFEHQH